MKTKLVLMIAFVLFIKMANSQTSIYGGINFANMKFSSGGFSFSPSSITGYHFGIASDFELNSSFYINTGLQFSLKGFKLDITSEGESFSGTNKLNYLEIPVDLKYKFQVRETSNIFIQAGPYIGYAVNGKEKSDLGTVDIEFGSDSYQRIDYGLGFGGGIEFGRVVARLNYQLGLANIMDGQDVEVKNRVLQISLGYIIFR